MLCVSPGSAQSQKDTAVIRLLLSTANKQLDNNEDSAALRSAEKALLLSTDLHFNQGRAAAYLLKGRIYSRIPLDDTAKVLLLEAFSIAKSNRDSLVASDALEEIGYLYTYGQVTNNDSMLFYNSQALGYSNLQKDTVILIRRYMNVGFAYYLLGKIDESMRYALPSLRMAELTRDTASIVLNLCLHAALLNVAQQYQEARATVGRAIDLKPANDKSTSRSSLLAQITLGWIYERSKAYDSLFSHTKLVLPLAREIQNTYYISLMYYRQAVYYNSKNAPAKAMQLLEQGLNALNYKDPNYAASAYREMGHAYYLQGNFTKAIDCLKKSLENATQIHDPGEAMDSYELLWQVYSRQQKYEAAMDAYILYNQYKDSVTNMHTIASMHLLARQYEFEKKEDRIKLLSAENELSTALANKESQRKKIAIATIIILVLAGAYGFYRFRKKKQLQQQQSILNERLRISRELHDEVGATLSGIAMYSHLTKEQMKQADISAVENSLNIMQQSAGQMVDKLNDIVWLINPEQDSLQKLADRLEEYALQMASVKNMQVKINISQKITKLNLPVEHRRNIYLFCKEAINNAVKYSNGTELTFCITEEAGQLQFSIADNGKGFDAVMVRRGNGLDNMQQRVDDIGAKLLLESKKETGTRVAVQVKLA